MLQINPKHCLVLIGLLCFNHHAFSQPAPLVEIAEVIEVEMAPTRKVAAYSKAKFITQIKAESSGRVLEIAAVGDSVEKGQPLGLIADEEYALRLNELNNALASQQAQVDFLKSESARLKSLETQNLTSGTALDKNKADLKAAVADLAQASSRLEQLENDIDKLTPKAPFNGFVTEQLAQPGQFLNEGQDILRIMSSDEIELIAQLPFKLKHVILIGSQWQFVNQQGDLFDALVERFIPAATSNSRMIQVHLKDMSGQLLPGEPVSLLVPETLPTQVTAVPRDALVLRRQGSHVFIIKEGVAHRVNVTTTGLAQGDLIAVEGSLQAGQSIVIRGNERLRDQQTVEIKSD